MLNKKILLVTTGVNVVRQQLEKLCGSNLFVVDCSTTTHRGISQCLYTLSYDILITYRCPYILPLEIIDNATMLAFNIHPSLLPAYAGLNPWEDMIRNNEKNGGVTFHVLTDEVDHGPIIMRESIGLDFSKGLAYNRDKVDELAGAMIKSFIIEF